MKHLQPATAMLTGAAGNRLVADVYGDTGQPVLLLHGGGQTRHAWGRTAEHLARGGALAYALDIRKFEIELYWKRATYYWAFIAAAFAGYALTYKTAADHEPRTRSRPRRCRYRR